MGNNSVIGCLLTVDLQQQIATSIPPTVIASPLRLQYNRSVHNRTVPWVKNKKKGTKSVLHR
ncbi:hypothetical protein [Candidatus Cardinium hertigii]|uniref:hypothetical protein n=1 Tax=Candidatus Cardinium hertigii TaxID=247481 RepID=UPI0013A5BB62|nr:hypothetical protein [Candidatus Cardinium hertigii]